jgi:hypothetical protein
METSFHSNSHSKFSKKTLHLWLNYHPFGLYLFHLPRYQTKQVQRIINTTDLEAKSYTFQVKAEAPDIVNRNKLVQSGSSSISGEITLTVTVKEAPPAIPVYPIEASPVTASPVSEGSTLSTSVLSGSFKDPNSHEPVSGTIEWTDGLQLVNTTGSFQWTFIPTNREFYNNITGYVEVVATPVSSGPTTIHYVALGDSLVTGTTGISGTMNSYVHKVFANLQGIYGAGNVTRAIFGYDGDTSKDLLDKLTDVKIQGEIKKANIITLALEEII